MDFWLWWFIFAFVIGVAAASRGRDGIGWFLLSVIISPLLALILLALMPNIKAGEHPSPDTHVKCPDCAELVLKEAKVCKHCGLRLTPQA